MSDKPVIIEYSGTNAAKAMQVHHLITTILGQSLSDLYEFKGYEAFELIISGIGETHFGKLIYAVKLGAIEVDIERNPNAEFLRLYVKFNTEAEKILNLKMRPGRFSKHLKTAMNFEWRCGIDG